MASVTVTRRRALLSHGSCLAIIVLALASLAAAAVAEENGGETNWHVVSVSSLLPSAAACTAAKAASSTNSSSVLSVVHRHGPCSPLLSRGGAPSHAEILDGDQDRVNSIHRKHKHKHSGSSKSKTDPAGTSNKGVSLPAYRGLSLGTGNYIVKVGLGTPAKDYSVVFDTGSDLSWVQCKPCKDCYEQQDPLFDPAQSSTYSAVPCGARECKELDTQGCSTDNKCRYEVVYGDQSQTDGTLARDTLTLGPSDDSNNKLAGFVFGCGDDDAGLFGKADGLFGLGRARVSLASQAAARYGAGFSYCLPSSSSGAGYLSLGPAAPTNAAFTPMLARADTPSFYYLDLVGVKVAGRTVRISPAVFRRAGTVIDSGTVITRLPDAAYAALRSAFARYMGTKYRRAPALSILDTCYDFTGYSTVQIPAVALVFAGGTELRLDFSGVLYVSKVSQACLAFASNGDDQSIGILGNTQQRTFAVVYDVGNHKVGFGAKGCA
ncbi:hypothetical protein PR202_ga15477 [Eleusine coracana subsp. coracana]|uniref:Peptidase A1 domain-containing protein n=1 Tax=Eleusine coracana subsp. coracana TaxID=191504 RepID=A0AAV5CKA4_ELECO|nr:hypothetical protein PR202_ga15477 [Eleusine coracana subsp. coracana]